MSTSLASLNWHGQERSKVSLAASFGKIQAVFDDSGKLLGIAEDLGRHTALDKLAGENFPADRLPLAKPRRPASSRY
jgi:FdhD/NarQ family